MTFVKKKDTILLMDAVTFNPFFFFFFLKIFFKFFFQVNGVIKLVQEKIVVEDRSVNKIYKDMDVQPTQTISNIKSEQLTPESEDE